MASNKIIFEKNYTRDITLIIEQIWLEVLVLGVKQELQIEHAHLPVGVGFINQGAIEVWENRAAIRFINNKLVEKSLTETQAMIDYLTRYEKSLERFYPIWKRGYVSSREDLRDFIAMIHATMCGDAAVMYLSELEGVEGSVQTLAKRLRGEDHFFSYSDAVLRQSLQRFFPALAEYVTCLREDEVMSGELPSIAECKKRFEHYVISADGYRATETLADYARHNPDFVFSGEEVGENIVEVRGQVACPGKARGRVRILRLLKDMAKVQDGDIIVSPMTIPTFLPAMKKSGAIVTEEGGMLCHAAVVSRELKKPCVIGTKIATKVFKDGDLVEVDAEHGIVRKIA